MASLRETLKSNRGLFQTSEEEIQKLAERNNLARAPISPQESKVIGANKDQAKMAGTPNQRISALRQQFEAEETLAGTQRREQKPSKGLSAAEEARKQELDSLQNLGNLNDRVRQIALNRFKQEHPAPTQLEFTEQAEGLAQDIQDRLSMGNATMDDYVQIAEQLGIQQITDASQLVSQVNSMLGIDTGASSEFIAGLAAGDLTLGELTTEDLTEMGYTDFSEIASSLGMTEEEASQLSLDGLQDVLDAKQAEEFDHARTARNILRDPASTAAQRAGALKTLERLQAAGIDDTEAQFEDIEKKIEEGQTIEFAGQAIHIDELMDNEYLELEIARALEDPDYMESLREKEPEFADFIEDHQAMFSELVDEVDADTQAFLDVQDQNSALAKPSEDMQGEFSADVMQTWYSDYGKLRADVYEPNGAIQVMQDPEIPTNIKQVLEEAIRQFSSTGNMELVQELGELSKEDILSLGLRNIGQVTQFTNTVNDLSNLEQLDSKKDADQIINRYLGAKDEKDLHNILGEALMLNSSGFGKVKGRALDVLDSNRDGKLDDMADIKKRLLNQPRSLKELLSQGKGIDSLKSPQLDVRPIRNARAANPIYGKVKEFFADGRISSHAEAEKMGKKLTNQELYTMAYKYKDIPGMNDSHRMKLRNMMNDRAHERARGHVDHHIQHAPNASELQDVGITNWKELDAALRKYRALPMEKKAVAGGLTADEQRFYNAAREAARHLRNVSRNGPFLKGDTPSETRKIIDYGKKYWDLL